MCIDREGLRVFVLGLTPGQLPFDKNLHPEQQSLAAPLGYLLIRDYFRLWHRSEIRR